MVKKIWLTWPEVAIFLQSDSHYSAPEVYDFCEEERIHYVLGLTPHPLLMEKSGSAISDTHQDLSAFFVSL